MSQLKLISFTRLTCVSSLRRIQQASSTVVQTPNHFHRSIQYRQYSQRRRRPFNQWVIDELAPEENIWSKAKSYMKFHLITKYIYRRNAAMLYRHVVDTTDHVQFMKDFRMADTYFSWFLITELHVWMLMVRLMAGGKPGNEVRKNLVGAMWQDADARRRQLGTLSTSVVAPQMQILGYQFNAAIIGYDEGLMSNDQILAGAIWRRFFLSECNDPELVEKMLAYIRKNISVLDTVPVIDIVLSPKVDFIHYNQC